MIEDDEWEDHLSTVQLSKIQRRKFMKALDLLKSTGDCNPFIGRPLPIKNTNASSKTDSSRHSSTSTQSATPAGASHIPSASSSKPATNRQVPPSKSGNLKSVRDFFSSISKLETEA